MVFFMKSCSMDLRERIIVAREEGGSGAEVASRFRISKRSVERYWKQYQSSGHVRARQRGGYKKSRLEGHDEPLRKWIDDEPLRKWINDEPGLTLEEIRGRCADELGVTIGINALWQRLDKLGLSFKKNPARKRTKPS